MRRIYDQLKQHVPEEPTVSQFRNRHKGAVALVLGKGPSMRDVERVTPRDVTIGVNTVSTEVPLDYLVVLDKLDSFTPAEREKMGMGMHKHVLMPYAKTEKWRRIFPKETMIAFYPNRTAENVVPHRWDDEICPWGWLPTFNGASYCATAFASYLGCSTIILGGVDYTGVHSWAKPQKLPRVIRGFRSLLERCKEEGSEVWNASAVSAVTSVPRLVTSSPTPPLSPPASRSPSQA